VPCRLRCARHHQADLGGLPLRQETLEQLTQLQGRKAAAEIIDQAVAFGLRKNGNDALGIDPSAGDCRLDSGKIVGGRSGNAVDLCDRHVASGELV
jgi:hypothetical protein